MVCVLRGYLREVSRGYRQVKHGDTVMGNRKGRKAGLGMIKMKSERRRNYKVFYKVFSFDSKDPHAVQAWLDYVYREQKLALIGCNGNLYIFYDMENKVR